MSIGSVNFNNQNIFTNGLLARSKNVGYKAQSQQPKALGTPQVDTFTPSNTSGISATPQLNAWAATQQILPEKEVDARNQALQEKLAAFDQNADLYDDMFSANANVGHFQNIVSSGALDKYDVRDRAPVVSNRILN